MKRFHFVLLFLASVAMFVVACGEEAEPTEEVDVDATVTAAVLTAVAESNPITDTPVPTPAEAEDTPTTPPTEAETETPAVATEAPTSTPISEPTAIPPTDAPTCRTLQDLNLRRGPGTAYNPPLRALPTDEILAPQAFQASGFPGGQWVLVEVINSGETGWVSAGPAFVTCNIDVAALPPAANIPPPPTNTPPPTDTPAPTEVASGPPQVSNVAVGGEDVQDFEDFDFQYQLSDVFLLRIDARDTSIPDSRNGDGISHVTFFVTPADGGAQLYQHQENIAGYCIFRGGEPQCNPWPQNENGRFTWGAGGPEVAPGRYRIDVTVFFEDERTFSWNTRFDVALP